MASTTAAISSMSSASSQAKAEAEITLAYKRVKTGVDSPVLSDSLKAKASPNSQDVITPLLEQPPPQCLPK